MKFYGVKKEGKFTLFKAKTYETFKLSMKDGPFVLDLKRGSKKRTLPQNKYYWGAVIKELSNHLGYEPDEMHNALKWQFLKKINDDPKKPPTVKSTSALSTKEFVDYINQIIRWAAIEFGVVIPDPEEFE